MKIGIINIPNCNTTSIYHTMTLFSNDVAAINSCKEIKSKDIIILPGVGNAYSVSKFLEKNGYFEEIKEFENKNKKIIGICLGMQMLFKDLNEGGSSKGLGFFSSEVLEISKISKLKTNIGWRKIKSVDKNFLENENYYYFCHSYYVNINDEDYSFLKCVTEENPRIPAIIHKNNIFGLQFHPEKSQKKGITLIKKFLEF